MVLAHWLKAKKLIALFCFIARAAFCVWYLSCLGDWCVHCILWLMIISAYIIQQELKQICPITHSSHSIFVMIFYPHKLHMMYTLDYLPAILYISNSKYCCFGSLLGWAFYFTFFEIDRSGKGFQDASWRIDSLSCWGSHLMIDHFLKSLLLFILPPVSAHFLKLSPGQAVISHCNFCPSE